MSFDAFETRLQFLQLLRKLNASIQSIQKVTTFALKNATKCGEDLWEVVLEESLKGTLNTRINILYFLDGLIESEHSIHHSFYSGLLDRDLELVVGRVVPDTREGVLNLRSAKQILESWRTRRVIDPETIDNVLVTLSQRTFQDGPESKKRSHGEVFSRNDILRRMEEDRERHKRLRERIWILPIPSLIPKPLSHPQIPQGSANPSPASPSPFTPASPFTKQPRKGPVGQIPVSGISGVDPRPPAPQSGEKGLDALEMEFEQTWESCGLISNDDLGRMKHPFYQLMHRGP